MPGHQLTPLVLLSLGVNQHDVGTYAGFAESLFFITNFISNPLVRTNPSITYFQSS